MSWLANRRRVSMELTTRDYVQSGLVAMWDGIENIGVGRHSDNVNEWVDLTGSGRNWQLINTASFNSNSLVLKGDPAAEYSNTIPANSHITQEIVFKITSDDRDNTNNRTVIALFGNTVLDGGYNLSLSGLAFNRATNNIGWMPKTRVLAKTNIATVPKTPICSTIIYDDNNSLTALPMQMFTNNIQVNTVYTTEGWANSSQRNRIGSTFYGNIYAIRIYNKALTAAEINKNFELDKKRFGLNI